MATEVVESNYEWLEGQGPAFGGPGLAPRWTSAAKDAVGTAYAASSRAWFTISHGILNEVYYPTIDRPQIRAYQIVVDFGVRKFGHDLSAAHDMPPLGPAKKKVRHIRFGGLGLQRRR